MKNKINVRVFGIIALVAVFTLSAASCYGQTLNSAEALKEYLNNQPANSPDEPIKVTMSANGPMLKKISDAINSTGKYVSLNLTGNVLTNIPDNAFYDENTRKGCETLVSIIIPNSVTSIGKSAFRDCESLTSITIPNSVTSIEYMAFFGSGLTSVTFQGTITSENFADGFYYTFYGDLRDKYLAGGIGTYTRSIYSHSDTWTKQ